MKKGIAIIALLIIIAIASPASAGEWFSWDDTNTKLHVPLTALMVIDLGQTLWMADNPTEYKYTPIGRTPIYKNRDESNPILGKNPSKDRIYKYFVGSYALTTAITYLLPDKWSYAFQGGIISLQIYAVENNYSLNVGFKF